MRIRILILAAFVFVCLLRPMGASAEWLTLTLNTPNPTGFIGISTLSGSFYDGVINWTPVNDNTGTYGTGTGQTTTPDNHGTSFTSSSYPNGISTYCIDTTHDISGGNYEYNVVSGSLSTILTALNTHPINPNPPGYTMAMIQGIANMYSLYATPGTLTPTNASSDPNANFDAATFQAALWDITGAGATLNNATFSGTYTDATTLTQTQFTALGLTWTGNHILDTAALWAYNAEHDATPAVDDFTALVGNQNQAIFQPNFGPNTPPAAPLPSVASTGLVLLTGVAGLALVRRRFTAVA